MLIEDFAIEKFLEKKISFCFRKFGDYDLSHIPLEKREQEADGITFIEFDDVSVFKLIANTENFTINIEEIKSDRWKDQYSEVVEVSKNDFWNKFLNREIINTTYINKFSGIEFKFSGIDEALSIVYTEESEFEFDALIVTEIASNRTNSR